MWSPFSLNIDFTSHFSAQNFSDLIPVHSGLVLTRTATDYSLRDCFMRAIAFFRTKG